MNKADIKDIQQALNWIRAHAENADSEAKVEILALLNGTSQSVIQMAKKLVEPETKTKIVTRYKDKVIKQKPDIIKQDTPPETATDLAATPYKAIKPQSPISPLANQQSPQ